MWSDAYSPLPVKASCTGTGSCAIRVTVTFDYQTYFDRTFYDAVDTIININISGFSWNGYIEFTATDQSGNSVKASGGLISQGNPYFSKIYSGTGNIFDFNYGKTLESDFPGDYNVNAWPKGRIVDIRTKQVTEIDTTGNVFPNDASSFLTPYGAIVAFPRVCDFNKGVLYDLPTSIQTLSHAGDYMTWLSASSASTYPAKYLLHVRNLNTLTDSLIIEDIYSKDNAVSSNGKVFYENNGNLFSYSNGVSNPVVNYSGDLPYDIYEFYYPVTDGNYLVYFNTFSDDVPYTLFLNDGNSVIELAKLGDWQSYAPSPGWHYQVNNKFVAYCKRGTSNQMQIWLRDSTGANKQVTFFANDSQIEFLAPNGDIIYRRDDNGMQKRFFAKKGELFPKDLGMAVGKLYYRDSSWYVNILRTLYKLNVDARATSANGNWTNTTSWENNTVPAESADVIVKNNIIVDANITCNSLKIVPPGSITVLPGFNLTVLH